MTVTDGVQVLRAAAGLSSDCASCGCDVNADGNTTVTDGVVVLRAAAGLPAPLNCPGVPRSIPCDRQPNFIAEVDLIRWSPNNLPLTMAIDVSGAPSNAYTSGDQRTFEFATTTWDDATGLDLIKADSISGRASSLRLFYTTSLPDDVAGETFFDVQANEIEDAEIQINTTVALQEDFAFNLDTVNHDRRGPKCSKPASSPWPFRRERRGDRSGKWQAAGRDHRLRAPLTAPRSLTITGTLAYSTAQASAWT